MNEKEFNALTDDEKLAHLKHNDDVLEDVVMQWGQKFAGLHDEINGRLNVIDKNHKETVDTLKLIGESLSKFTTAVFGNSELDYIGVLKRQSELHERLSRVEDTLHNVVLKKDFDKIEQDLKSLSTNVKNTTKLMWGILVGGVAFTAWLAERALEIFSIIKDLPHH